MGPRGVATYPSESRNGGTAIYHPAQRNATPPAAAVGSVGAGATRFYGRWSQADLRGHSPIPPCRGLIQMFVWRGPIQIAGNRAACSGRSNLAARAADTSSKIAELPGGSTLAANLRGSAGPPRVTHSPPHRKIKLRRPGSVASSDRYPLSDRCAAARAPPLAGEFERAARRRRVYTLQSRATALANIRIFIVTPCKRCKWTGTMRLAIFVQSVIKN
jgi:hypothetical protein